VLAIGLEHVELPVEQKRAVLAVAVAVAAHAREQPSSFRDQASDVIDASDLELSSSHETVLPTDRSAYERGEARQLRAALYAADWNISQVARELGTPRQSLYRKLRRYGIHRS